METTNYLQFKRLEQNRLITKRNVNLIIESIKEIGYLKSRPVIVDANFYVIDGHHRIEACSLLGIPVFYEIENIDASLGMTLLNAAQKVWSLSEYINRNASNGISCYIEYNRMKEEFKAPQTVMICVAFGNTGGSSSKNIKKGNHIKINPRTSEILTYINRCKDLISFYDNKEFCLAVVSLFNRTTVSNREIILDNIQSIKRQAAAATYLQIFENILNKRKKKDFVSLTAN